MRQVKISRVASDTRRRRAQQASEIRSGRNFAAGEWVLSCAEVLNDGSYPHKDVDEVLVAENDRGCVRESFSFLGQFYYTVEFPDRGVTVIMRGRELASAVLG